MPQASGSVRGRRPGDDRPARMWDRVSCKEAWQCDRGFAIYVKMDWQALQQAICNDSNRVFATVATGDLPGTTHPAANVPAPCRACPAEPHLARATRVAPVDRRVRVPAVARRRPARAAWERSSRAGTTGPRFAVRAPSHLRTRGVRQREGSLPTGRPGSLPVAPEIEDSGSPRDSGPPSYASATVLASCMGVPVVERRLCPWRSCRLSVPGRCVSP